MREQTAAAVQKMRAAWDAAPLHIKAMAGKHVEPLIAAIAAINAELEQLEEDLTKGVK